MSGGHFDYHQSLLTEIAQRIEEDIALALKPKPEKVHEDYWTILEADTPSSWHSLDWHRTFQSYEEAEDYLRRWHNVRPADPKYRSVTHFSEDDVLFQSEDRFMKHTKDGEKIPVIYAIHHAVYDRYPYDVDVLELTDATIETMKEAYRQICIARIYADRVDWMMSGDDSEETLQERLKYELEKFEEEFREKDWTQSDEEDED